jgi:NDP-sugar pyrophosphorylase family protein
MSILSSNATTPAGSTAMRPDLPAILLVGGLGTRLQKVLSSKPKPLAPVGNIPFLQLLVMQLRSHGVRRLIMCTGHLADQVETAFGDGRQWDVEIAYSKESQPLGTAGAVKFAEGYLKQDADFLVVNGDSFVELDVRDFVRFHREHGGPISMVVSRVPNAARYGTVHVDAQHRIVGFNEKTGNPLPGIINAGVYVFNRDVLDAIPEGPASLEKDLFPHFLQQGMYALEQHGEFIDIGTPEDYERAKELFQKLYQAAVAEPHLEPHNRPAR